MKKLFLVCLCSLALPACSLFLHNPEDPDGAAITEATTPETITENKNNDAEISKLKTRVEALETKLDVLSNSMERTQLKRSQPDIVAEPANTQPQPNMAAPVSEAPMPVISAKVESSQVLPAETKTAANADTAEDQGQEPAVVATPTKKSNSAIEAEFKTAMELFQNGRNLEASTKFSSIARTYKGQLLAGHALYWAGEANARSQQWSTAVTSWELVEKDYPHSTYMPEVLAGLSRAYEAQGNMAKAKAYRDTLVRAFPNAPVTLNLVTHDTQPQTIDGDAPTPHGNEPITDDNQNTEKD